MMPAGYYEVYHLKPEAWNASQSTGGPVHFPADYELVARVKALSLEGVYRKTNGLDGPWWERPDVQCIKPSRSTSIDDVAVCPKGNLHVLGWNGWDLVREAAAQTHEVKPAIEQAR